ncbi:MAG TPA: hypothetical protein VE135_03200 [Pyrinomonadaceae bacterium]|nr:hypothetical protein [Pyrinomonadaceae bacterium]
MALAESAGLSCLVRAGLTTIYENIQDYERESRTTMLEIMKNKLVRG